MEDDKGFNFFQEKIGLMSTVPPIVLSQEDVDRKLLGIPWYEYLTVGLVVVFAAGTGGGVAILCQKCGGMFGRRQSNKKENQESNTGPQGTISLTTLEW